MPKGLGNFVYIGGITTRMSERDIEDSFSKFGRILKVDHKGSFGFVEYESSREADEAVHNMNNADVTGHRLKVEHAKGPRRDKRPANHTEYRVLVDNLPYNATWQQLKDHFRKAGEVVFADVCKDSQGRSKGYGIVEFRVYDDMKRAIRKLHDTEILPGSYISVKEEAPSRSSSSRGRRYSPYSSSSSSRRRSYSRSPRRSPRRSPPRRRASRSPRRRYSRSPRPRSASPKNNGGTTTSSSSSSRRERSKERTSKKKSPSRTPSPKKGASKRNYSASPKRSPSKSPAKEAKRSPTPETKSPADRKRSESPAPAKESNDKEKPRSRTPPSRSQTPQE